MARVTAVASPKYDDGDAASPLLMRPRVMAAAAGAGAAIAAAEERSAGEDFPIVWNMRTCTGTLFHKYIIDGRIADVEAVLLEDPSAAVTPFKWTTIYAGEDQENTGRPIHLAASRGHVDIVTALLGARADINAHVWRGDKPNYNVLNAAVWAEGKGGTLSMLELLLRKGAKIEDDLGGRSPLHLAFTTGAVDLLPALREAAQVQTTERGISVYHEIWNNPKGSPLESGIRSGHMTELALAKAASPTPASLRTFIELEPRCLRPFLRQLKGQVKPSQLAKQVSGDDFARVLREYPDAACALFSFMTAAPKCEEPTLNPLPARVSFGPRSKIELLRDLVNPTQEMLAFYERDITWRFDGNTRFEGAAWQKHIDSRKWGKPYRDAELRVCHVPNLICVELFAALMASSGRYHADEASLKPFKEPVIRGIIEYVWWNGAVRYDLFQVYCSLWGLALLVYDSVTAGFGGEGHKVSVDFLSAKGVADALMVAAQFVGWCTTVAPKQELFTRQNCWLLACVLLPILLRFTDGDGYGNAVKVSVIFIYWLQMFDIFTVSETASRSILPITRLVAGVIPAGLMTSVWFCAFLHAFQVVRQGGESSFLTNLLETCSTLLTGDMQAHEGMSGLQLMIAYFAVAIFTVYLLNIFISVIEEEFESQKEMSKETFQLMRADKCLAFLARAQVLPCRLLGRNSAARISACAATTAVAIQIWSFRQGQCMEWSFQILAALLWLMGMCSLQDRHICWLTSDRHDDRCYLWLVLSRASFESSDGGDDVSLAGDEEMGADRPREYDSSYSHNWLPGGSRTRIASEPSAPMHQ